MDSHSFARVTMHNVVWAFLASGSGKLLSVAGLAVLARILAPDAFGLLAFGLLFIMYVDTVGDFGTGAALIARRERAEDAAQVTFVVNLCAGALWFGLSWMMAPVAAGFFHQPEAIPIVRALAWSFPLRALGNTHDALARKAMRFRVRSIPEIGIVVTRVGVSVGLALAGLGVWSLVWGHLAGYAVWSLLLWVIVEWRPRWELRTDLLKPMFSYGRGIVVTNVLAAVVHHFDFVMVGRVLGAVELGLYQMAHKIPQATITLATWTTGKVLFPAFSLAGADPELLRKSFVSSLRYLCLLVVPAAGVFVLFAEPIVTLLLGDAWARSAPVLKALALAAAFRAIGSPAGDVLKAVGRSSLLAKLALVKALVMVPAVALAAPHGGVAVAWSVAGVTLATSTMNLVVGSRIVGVGRGEVIKTFRPAMEGGKP